MESIKIIPIGKTIVYQETLMGVIQTISNFFALKYKAESNIDSLDNNNDNSDYVSTDFYNGYDQVDEDDNADDNDNNTTYTDDSTKSVGGIMLKVLNFFLILCSF